MKTNPILKDHDLDMFTFFELTPDLVCIAGKDGYFRKVNHSVTAKLEYTIEELFSRPISSFIYHEDQELTHNRRSKLLEGKPLMNFENRYVTKSGKIVWLAWTSIYFPEKEVVFAIAKDITERKLIEHQIEEKYKKFKNLAFHFKTSLEEDKKYLATELHDELAQLAAVIKMDINWILNNENDLTESTKSRMEHASVISNLMIKTIRRISFAISPNMLEDLGLNSTIEWYCKEFTLLNGIPCNFEFSYNEVDLTPEISLDFFRVCQEALNNVLEHSRATSVKISIEEVDHKILLCIKDNGQGFDINNVKPSRGFIHMKERIASINGQLILKSSIGKGTQVLVQISKLRTI